MRISARASRSLLSTFLVASSLLAGGAAAALAQGETGVGVEVPYVDDAGIDRGTIELRQLDDPFTEFDPASPAEAGSRYVGAIVAFTAADDQQMDTYPFGVSLVDTTGTIWTPNYVPRPAEAIVPDAQSQTMAPGNRVSGFIGWVLPDDVVIDQVVYQPDYYRAIELADLVPGAGPAAGAKVNHTDTTGAMANVSASVIDPFPDFDPGYPAADGTRYVMVDAAFEAAGDRGYAANPYEIILHLSDGHLVYGQSIPRPYDAPRPLLEGQTMSPGDRISGFIPYIVPADAQIVSVDYQPEGNQRIVIADLANGGAGPAASPAPSASEAPVASEAPAVSEAPAPTAAPSEPAASAGTAQ